MTGALSAAALLVGASVASAESFGKPPGPDQSRCAPIYGKQRILKIGQRLKLRAGPITDQCGGPPRTTRYAWETTDPADPAAALGLQQVGHCGTDAPRCTYEAVMFTQPGMWQGVGINGTSPDGGWGSGIGYAVQYGHYFAVSVSTVREHTESVSMNGHGLHWNTTAASSGWFNFAALPGTYTFSWSSKGQEVHRTVQLSDQPDQHLTVYFERNHTLVEKT